MFKTIIKAGTLILICLYQFPANSTMIFSPANTILSITYTDGVIAHGPLSFGLKALPLEILAQFELDPPPPLPGGPIPIPYPHFFRDIDQVVAGNISFGNTTWTTSNLMTFEMNTDAFGVLENLSYRFEIDGGGIALNFPLRISGVEGGIPFEYVYSEFSYTLSQVSAPTTITLLCLGVVMNGWLRRKII